MLGAKPTPCACVCVSASLPEPWAAGPDTAGHKDLQTMFTTVGLLLGLDTKDARTLKSMAAETGDLTRTQ